MAGIIKQLRDRLSNNIFPVTLTKSVYDEAENRLDNILSSLNMKLDSLIIGQSLTTDETTYSLPTGKKFSDYDFVLIIINSVNPLQGGIGDAKLVPLTLFAIGQTIRAYYTTSSSLGTQIKISDVEYTSDTTIKASAQNNEVAQLFIYGIKLKSNLV